MKAIPSSEITPEAAYLSRRSWLRQAGALGIGAAMLAACGSSDTAAPVADAGPTVAPTAVPPPAVNELTPEDAVTGYNNYYEFSTDKEAVAPLARAFTVAPWTVEVGGLVNKPKTFALEDLLTQFPSAEHVYRHRCVEGWSMVIPWQGFALGKLLAAVEPTSAAKYVRFTSIARESEMPGLKDTAYPWPYTEGLRLDEAMNELALLVTGLYGKELPPQNGAPLRLALPWKYGFKSVKAIVKIETGRRAAPHAVVGDRARRVRLLCQRQPGSESPALVAVERAAHRRERPPQNAAVQWLRRAGRRPLCGHGPAKELLRWRGFANTGCAIWCISWR